MASKEKIRIVPAGAANQDITGNASDGPAIYINRLVVTGGGMIKVSFMEQDSESRPAHFRTAVMMPYVVAMQMIDIINNTIEQDKSKVREMPQERPQ